MADHPEPGLSLFTRVFDLVVVGSGYAGFAAVLAARGDGRSVLLVGERGDLVWESGRGFCDETGHSDDPTWREFLDAVGERGGRSGERPGEWIDGALAEVVATDRLVKSGAHVLYYARPVAVETSDGALTAVVVATKAGLRRVVGRQWIDATETGSLLRLLDPGSVPRVPLAADVGLMFQHADWSAVPPAPELRTTAWPTERVLRVGVTPGDPRWREDVLSALERLEASLGPAIAEVSMSHLSIEPVGRYAPGAPAVVPGHNVAVAVPGCVAGGTETLADRFALGVAASARLDSLPAGEVPADVLTRPIPSPAIARTLRADVCVAGAGTGGAVASMAAAMTGVRVVCVEPQAFLGGVGTGGGIHGYWYGVPGGLQRDVDRRTRELMSRFGGGPLGDGPFNPWAKAIALEQLLGESGVDLVRDALVFAVEQSDSRVTAALVATPEGVLRIEAAAFVDGTGDGDLAAAAGAAFTLGREVDGVLHAYSQSSGRLYRRHGRPRMMIVNFDAGFCDPTDPEDLTRARLEGIRQYLADHYEAETRPTYIAPHLGLRQGRQIVTDYVLTLDDQISGRRFDDAIGYTGAHYENHASDLEFASDEALFWVWGCRRWLARIGCELSYRSIVPRGLDNVWIASRCLGVSQDAHNSTRMQRDAQRVGEAAGLAAGLAVQRGETARDLPYAELRRWLDRTGALDRTIRAERGAPFGTEHTPPPDPIETDAEVAPDTLTALDALATLDAGETGALLWWLAQNRETVGDAVLARLANPDPQVSWLAALVAAMWEEPAAEPRLLRAIETWERGPDAGGAQPGEHPMVGNQIVPYWLCALALVRRCGSARVLPVLTGLLSRPVHGMNSLTTLALTIERLARRGVLTGDDLGRAAEIVDRILEVRPIGVVDAPSRRIGRFSEAAIGNGRGDESGHESPPWPDTRQDSRWQLHLAVARARDALGLIPHPATEEFVRDPRSFVRRAFSRVGER